MRDKYELMAHLANITFVFDYHEKGGTTKNPYIVAEAERTHDELVKVLKQEQEDEARNRKEPTRADEAGTGFPRS